MNDKPCKQCRHYDPIIGSRQKELPHGRCATRSIYPAKEGPGQTFPPGVKRAEEGKVSTPYIVRGAVVVPHCILFEEK